MFRLLYSENHLMLMLSCFDPVNVCDAPLRTLNTRKKPLFYCLLKVSGRTEDWQMTDDVRPSQPDVVWMSESAAEYAKYATVISPTRQQFNTYIHISVE